MTATIETIPERAALPVCLPLSRGNPYRLVSLMEIMKAFKACDLMRCARSLHNTAALIFERDSGLAALQRSIQVDSFRDTLRNFVGICDELELPMSSLHGSQLLATTSGAAAKIFFSEEADRLTNILLITVENELSLRQFFSIAAEKSKYYSLPEPFGASVSDSFPSAAFDIDEAGRCYALGRSTACVMHLMRVLEVGLSVFAPTLRVDTNHKDWGKILSEIEKSVTSIESSPNKPPRWKDDREFNFQCIADFRVFKNAWRNASMHGRGKYGDEEALDIMNRVRSFMQTLAQKLSESSGTM